MHLPISFAWIIPTIRKTLFNLTDNGKDLSQFGFEFTEKFKNGL